MSCHANRIKKTKFYYEKLEKPTLENRLFKKKTKFILFSQFVNWKLGKHVKNHRVSKMNEKLFCCMFE